MTSVTVNGNTYNDGDVAPNNMGNGGHRTYFMPMLSDAVADLAAKQAASSSSASTAAAAAVTAVNAPGTSATSITSDTIALGSTTITIQTGKSLVVGMSVKIASTASPTNWMAGDITAYNSGTGDLTVNVTSILGSGTVSAWTVSLSGPAGSSGGGTLVRSPRTSNTILGASDAGKLIDITSGTFTQTFTAAATLTSGWYCWIRNSGTGDITLDPNASELIDGLTSYVMYPQEARLVQCDGTGFNSVVVHSFSRTLTTSGTFIRPPGYVDFDTEAWGAGGGGGSGGNGATNTFGGGGGGGGGGG